LSHHPADPVLTAFFADIHANRQAFSACLAQARDDGAERFVLLGDYVGYGGDPDWVLTRVMDLADAGAPAVAGNHDHAIAHPSATMNVEATVAIEFTRGELGREQRQFLEGLPLTVRAEDRLYVHADASHPGHWTYVAGTAEAAASMVATDAQLSFCGHIHRPAVYSMSATAKMTSFTPVTGVPIPLLPGRRWLAVLGAVGQPRDGNPAASYAMFDSRKRELTYCRAPYDIDAAADRIRSQGLPAWLADRLFVGR
jgi:diadenosine tetraphosphatase ApaH/serine/threonine PP2A family protein phosphatase